MKLIKSCLAGLLLAAPVLLSAETRYTGTVNTSSGEIFATDPWSEGTRIDYDIFLSGDGIWTYSYVVQLPWKDLSHSIIPLCTNVTTGDVEILSYDGVLDTELGWNKANNANPGLSEGVYGLKEEWNDIFEIPKTYTISFRLDRTPGFQDSGSAFDLYLKGGKHEGEDVFAYVRPGFIPVPTCEMFNPVPEVDHRILLIMSLTVGASFHRKR